MLGAGGGSWGEKVEAMGEGRGGRCGQGGKKKTATSSEHSQTSPKAKVFLTFQRGIEPVHSASVQGPRGSEVQRGAVDQTSWLVLAAPGTGVKLSWPLWLWGDPDPSSHPSRHGGNPGNHPTSPPPTPVSLLLHLSPGRLYR